MKNPCIDCEFRQNKPFCEENCEKFRVYLSLKNTFSDVQEKWRFVPKYYNYWKEDLLRKSIVTPSHFLEKNLHKPRNEFVCGFVGFASKKTCEEIVERSIEFVCNISLMKILPPKFREMFCQIFSKAAGEIVKDEICEEIKARSLLLTGCDCNNKTRMLN